MKNNILQIMYSDYGASHTMGIRLYYINKYNNKNNYKTICRSSIVKDDNIITTSKAILLVGKAISFLVKRSKYFRPLKGFDLYLFKHALKNKISDDISLIHIFNAYPDIVDYAHKKNIKVIGESFTHPLYIQKMFNEGMKLDRDYFTPNPKEIEYYKKLDYIISPSKFVTKTLEYANIEKSKIIEIPYGVNAQNDRIYEPILQKKLVFLFAGGIKATKGFNELIDSWIHSGMHKKDDVKLVICGRVFSSVVADSYQKAREISNIEFRGFVKSMDHEYKNADIYIYPTYHEGSSKTVFEAMSYGLPVITTENAGSIVRDDIDGFIVSINNVDALVEKIKYFYDNGSAIEQMGKSAQSYSRHFTWKLYAKKVNALYEKVLNNEN